MNMNPSLMIGRWGLVCLLASAAAPCLAADITPQVQTLNFPATQFYGTTNGPKKQPINDVAGFDGKVYLSHGNSNNGVAHRVLFYDPAMSGGAGGFGQDLDASGNPYRFNEERTDRFYVLENQLYLLGYDPFLANSTNGAVGSSNSKVYRKEGNLWAAYDITNDAHNQNFTLHGGRFFVTYGVSTAAYPGIWSGTQLGTLFSAVPPANPLPAGTPRAELDDFFTLGGKLYSTTPKNASVNGVWVPTSQPWMLRYDPTTHRMEDGFSLASEFLPASSSALSTTAASPTITNPVNLPSGRLVFTTFNDLFFADAITPGGAQLVDPLPASFSYLDTALTSDGVFALAQQRQSQSSGVRYVNKVLFSPDGAQWTELFQFTQLNIQAHSLTLLDGDIYLGATLYANFVTSGSALLRVPASAFAIPEPSVAALIPIWLLGHHRRRS